MMRFIIAELLVPYYCKVRLLADDVKINILLEEVQNVVEVYGAAFFLKSAATVHIRTCGIQLGFRTFQKA
jgi:hypothetical protein